MPGALWGVLLPETRHLLLFAALAVGSLVVSLGITVLVLVRLPSDYFAGPKRGTPLPRTPRRILAIVGKNALGWILIVLGIALSVPGVPGQGILTILIGVILIDFPGKYRFERAILRRRAVRGVIDRIRARFGKPPFESPGGG